MSSQPVPIQDVRAQNAPLREQLLATMARVLDAGTFILGPDVGAFENEFVATTGSQHAVAVSSGTDALLVALMALGVASGDEVITTPFSFYATAGCIVRLGARPVFADIEPASFNLDPAAAAAAAGPNTRAAIPVHLFGRPAILPKVSVPVIEDAAQAVGIPKVGGLARCYSFFPSKNLGGFGDAGAVATDDEAFADRVRLLRTHGSQSRNVHLAVGGNFRMDTLQAALLRVKLPHLRSWNDQRRTNAQRYRNLFGAQRGIPDDLLLPADVPDHTYNQFVIRAPARDELRAHLANHGIGSEVYYPIPFHLQPCFQELGYKEGAFPHAEGACREALAIPIYPELNEAQQSRVVAQISTFYSTATP